MTVSVCVCHFVSVPHFGIKGDVARVITVSSKEKGQNVHFSSPCFVLLISSKIATETFNNLGLISPLKTSANGRKYTTIANGILKMGCLYLLGRL